MKVRVWRFKHTIALIVALALAVGTFVLVSGVVRQKPEESLMFERMYELPENSVDVLFIGNSHIYTANRADLLYARYGISSFNIAPSLASIVSCYYMLEESIKTQSPKVVVIDAYSALYHGKWQRLLDRNIAPYRPSLNKFDAIQAEVPPDERTAYMLDVSVSHDRWTSLSEDDFFGVSSNQKILANYKGSLNTDLSYKIEDMSTEAAIFEDRQAKSKYNGEGGIEPKQKEYLLKIIELCKQNDISLQFIRAPYFYSDAFGSEQDLKNILTQNEVPFTDYKYGYAALGINLSTDFYNFDHFNWMGSAKYTETVYRDVLAQYNLADHRGDPMYDSWDINAYEYEALTVGYRIMNYGKDVSQLKDLLSFEDASLIPEATALTKGDQMAAGAIGSPYQIVVDFTMSDKNIRLGDVISSGVKLTEKEARQSTGIWLIKDGKVLKLKDKKHPYRLLGSYTLDYNASITYKERRVAAEDAGEELPSPPELLISNEPFELKAGTAAVLVYDSRLDEFITKVNVE